jgi:hypothetical protein
MSIVMLSMMHLDHVLLLAEHPAPFPFSPSSNTAGIYSQGKTEARSRTTQHKAGYPALCPVKDIGFPVHTTLVSLASLHLTS